MSCGSRTVLRNLPAHTIQCNYIPGSTESVLCRSMFHSLINRVRFHFPAEEERRWLGMCRTSYHAELNPALIMLPEDIDDTCMGVTELQSCNQICLRSKKKCLYQENRRKKINDKKQQQYLFNSKK